MTQQHVPVLRTSTGSSNGVRVIYTHEDGIWWAYADFRFSAADDTLDALKSRVHRAMAAVIEPDAEIIEIVND